MASSRASDLLTGQAADLVIVGGGLAGLSLAVELARRDCPLRVHIVEPRQTYIDDRSWCFWERPDHPLSALVSQRWRRWRCSRANRAVSERSTPGQVYQYVRSIDFYRSALQVLKACPNINLQTGRSVLQIERVQGRFQVATSAGSITAPWVIDTRPPGPLKMQQSQMFQCFAGQVIEMDTKPGFEPDCVELMTEMVCDRHGLLFCYVLPFSAQRALVEATRFSAAVVSRKQLDRDLEQLRLKRGWESGRVERSEHGVLPMGLPPSPPPKWPGFVRAGTGGGGLRAASGFGFLRIQRWARSCAQSLTQGLPPHGHAPDPWRQRAMDRLFLKVLRSRPELGPRLFEQLMVKTDPAVFVRFMSDQAGWRDSLHIVRSLPHRPFIHGLLAGARPDRVGLA